MALRPIFFSLRATLRHPSTRPRLAMSPDATTRRSKRSLSSATSPPLPASSASPTKKARTTVKGEGPPSPTKKGKGKASATPSPVKKAAAYQASPYPDFARPTPEDCQLVTDKLAAMHGMPVRKAVGAKIEGGALGQACGAVPSVSDALIRTILSQNTTNTNSSRAYASLLEAFGPSSNDTKAVDLVNIHRSPLGKLTTSIQCGGLANVKSKVIKNVLVEVRERNVSRSTSTSSDPGPSSSTGNKENGDAVKSEEDEDVKPDGKNEEEALLPQEAEEKLLSLDYVHGMTDEQAMKELESFKGVGPKTASCVLLFCLARDSFAVDTHVYRLSQQLNWVPAKATRQTTYEHLDVRIPAELRYPLHVLLIAHGKACPRCAASKKTSRPSLGPCPLVGLSDSKKGSKLRSPKKGIKGEESEAEESDLTEDEEGEEVKVEDEEAVEQEDGDGAVKEEGGVKEEEGEGEVGGLGDGPISEELKEQQQRDVEEAVRVAHGG